MLRELKNRDDEMTQKKRPMCMMPNEHREYFVANMPLDRMHCTISNPSSRASPSSAIQTFKIVKYFKIIAAASGIVCAQMCF